MRGYGQRSLYHINVIGLIVGGDKGTSNVHHAFWRGELPRNSPRIRTLTGLGFGNYPASVVCGAERIIPLSSGKAQGFPNLNGADGRRTI
jgi:hypothetical protein